MEGKLFSDDFEATTSIEALQMGKRSPPITEKDPHHAPRVIRVFLIAMLPLFIVVVGIGFMMNSFVGAVIGLMTLLPPLTIYLCVLSFGDRYLPCLPNTLSIACLVRTRTDDEERRYYCPNCNVTYQTGTYYAETESTIDVLSRTA